MTYGKESPFEEGGRAGGCEVKEGESRNICDIAL